MVGDFGWGHEGTKSGVGTVNKLKVVKEEVAKFIKNAQ